MPDINEQLLSAMTQLEEQHVEEQQPPQEEPTEPSTPEAKPRARDDAGKFVKSDAVPKDKEQEPKEAVKPEPTPAPTPAPSPAPAPVAQKPAPVSWRPEVRGKFGSLPPDIQEEISRREREIEYGLREASGAKKFTLAFAEVIQPYQAMLSAEGVQNPLEAVKSFFNTAYVLRTASPRDKAQLVARMINQFQVDIDMLDAALVHGIQNPQAPPQNDPTLQYVQQRLQPVEQFMQELMQMRSTANETTRARLQQEIDAAQQENAEFWDDIRDDVADILELAARRGQKISLQDAINRAKMAHPTISKTIADRTLEQQAAQRTAAARKSREASASLPSGGAPEQRELPKAKDHVSAISQAWDQLESRGN